MASLERFSRAFAAVRAGRQPGLIPYFTSGFPDNDTVAAAIAAADSLRVPVIEIGFPFSDSIADGPVVQASHHAALAQGHCVEDAFRLAEAVRPGVSAALVAMVSYSLVYRGGVERFARRAVEAGFDGVIVPDAPVEEAAGLRQSSESIGLAWVGLISPTTPVERRHKIAQGSSGFVYQMAVAGTTGERRELPVNLAMDVEAMRAVTTLPIAVGFGISTPQQVRAVTAVADAAIVGSALIARMEKLRAAGRSGATIVEEVAGLLSVLASGS